MKPNLLLIKNEFKTTKRVLPEVKPKELNPPVFEVKLIDFENPGIKWHYSITKYWGR